jgi:hypothetical protein
MRRLINNGDRIHALVLAASMTTKKIKGKSLKLWQYCWGTMHRFRLRNQNKNGTGADLNDIVTCAKFGLEPAEKWTASAALFFESNAARNWLNLY